MNITNIDAARALVTRYRNIGLKEIKDMFKLYDNPVDDLDEIKEHLTGFGITTTCTLCIATKIGFYQECNDCIYNIVNSIGYYACYNRDNKQTYDAISNVITPQELLSAYRKRATHLNKLIRKYDKLNKEV